MGTEFLDKTGLTHLWEQITGKMSNYIPTSQKNAASGVAGLGDDGKVASSLLPTIPISKGGTGATSASAALTNLGAAAASHKHAAGDITSGTLAIANGGTGASDAATARTNLQVLTYKQYDNGYFETGAGNTSAWLQYQVSGETKCQMDLFSDGKVGIGGKTVLVAGDVIPYTKYNDNSLSMDSWLDNNCYTLMLRDGTTTALSLVMWKDGNFTINGSKVATEARDNTFTGDLTVSKADGFYFSGITEATTDADRPVWFGGQNKTGAPTYNANLTYNPSTHKLKLDGYESQTLWMRNATSDTAEVSITFFQGSTQRWTLGAGCGSAGNDFTLWDHTNSTLALDMRSNKYLYVYGNWVYDQRSVVYSSTAPTDVYTGKIWLKPV